MNFGVLSRLIRALSSAGRAPALQAGGHRFDPYSAHQREVLEFQDSETFYFIQVFKYYDCSPKSRFATFLYLFLTIV